MTDKEALALAADLSSNTNDAQKTSGAEDVTKTRVSQYDPKIIDGYPPERVETKYDTKMFNGALMQAAERIRPGQCIENLSAGSAGKFARLVESRGLKVVRRRGQGESRGTIYVVTPAWLAENPDV